MRIEIKIVIEREREGGREGGREREGESAEGDECRSQGRHSGEPALYPWS